MLRRWISSVAALCLLMCVSCATPTNVEITTVNSRGWREAAGVVVKNSDTLSLRKLSIVIRYNSRFEPVVLPLFIRVTAPDGRIFDDVQGFSLQGGSAAKVVSMVESLPYRDSVQLSLVGEYTFEFTPTFEIKGVEAIGVEIE